MTYLSVKQAAQYLQVPPSVIYAHWKLFGGVKIGKHIRIPQEGIDEFMLKQGEISRGIARQFLQKPKQPGESPISVQVKTQILRSAHLHSRKFIKKLME